MFKEASSPSGRRGYTRALHGSCVGWTRWRRGSTCLVELAVSYAHLNNTAGLPGETDQYPVVMVFLDSISAACGTHGPRFTPLLLESLPVFHSLLISDSRSLYWLHFFKHPQILYHLNSNHLQRCPNMVTCEIFAVWYCFFSLPLVLPLD